MACPRLGSFPPGYIINEPNTEAVDRAGCSYNNSKADGVAASHSKVLCVNFGKKTKDYCGEERCGLTTAVVCVCSSQHYYYLDDLRASANDGTGHTVKVTAYWQVNVLLITDCDASFYSYLTLLHLMLTFTSNLFIYSLASLTLFQLFAPLYKWLISLSAGSFPW